MIDMTYDYAAEKQSICECGDPECIGPAETVQAAVEALVLDSPVLKLVKERNEARELVKRMHAAVNVDSVGEEYYSAMLDAHRAIIGWKGGAQ
jgi:hypothetical protein